MHTLHTSEADCSAEFSLSVGQIQFHASHNTIKIRLLLIVSAKNKLLNPKVLMPKKLGPP
jgi:hypothetical protein